jgi:hypothetical protein
MITESSTMKLDKKSYTIILIAAGAMSLPAIGLFSSKTQAQGTPVTKAALTVSTVSPANGSLATKLAANCSVAAWQ